MKRAVFLDRDGVINETMVLDGRPVAPASVDAVQLRPGVEEALEALRRAGFLLIVVTNQPDVGKGLVRREAVETIHAALRRRLPLDDLKVCYHVDADGCACRKPKPGLLLEAARERGIDLGQSVMVGDRWRDIEAGRAAGCRTVLVRASYDERPAERPDAAVDSLSEASAWILASRSAAVSHAEVSR